MILSDRDILRRLEAGDLVIEPLSDPDIQIQPASVDLRLGREFLEFQQTNIPCIHPDAADEVEEYVSETIVDSDEEFILHPGDFVLGTTKERVSIPPDLIAHVEGRSSLGRLAIVVHASLPADEELFVWTPASGFGFQPIGDIVEHERQARVVGFDPRTLRVSTHPITNYIRNPTKRIVRVTLRSGRQVHVTRDHNLFTIDQDGGVTRLPSEQAAGSLVMVPGTLPNPRGTRRQIDLSRLLDAVSTVYPYAADGTGDVDTAVAPPTGITTTAGTGSLPQQLPVTPSLGWVCGWLITHGTVSDDCITISGDTKPPLTALQSWFDRPGVHATLETTTSGWQLTITSPLWAHVSRHLLRSDGTWTLPDHVWDWPTEAVSGLLAGLAGCSRPQTDPAATPPDDLCITVPTESLADHLMYLATRLDLRPSIRSPADHEQSGWQLTCTPTVGEKIPAPGTLLMRLRKAADLTVGDTAAAVGTISQSQIHTLETEPTATTSRATLQALCDLYADAGVDTTRLEQLLCGELRFEAVTDVTTTDRVEPTYDLEVQPAGRPVENFLGGRGGIFLSNTAGLCDPGYEGQITLELSNLGAAPVALSPGMRISQLTFTELTERSERPYGSERGSKYQGQSGPQASRIGNDREFGGDQ